MQVGALDEGRADQEERGGGGPEECQEEARVALARAEQGKHRRHDPGGRQPGRGFAAEADEEGGEAGESGGIGESLRARESHQHEGRADREPDQHEQPVTRALRRKDEHDQRRDEYPDRRGDRHEGQQGRGRAQVEERTGVSHDPVGEEDRQSEEQHHPGG